MSPKISIICPVYQAKAYLDRCVKSILKQTFTHFELLLIDDGSSDGSALLCDEYARKDSRVWVFHKANGGVCSARNWGLDHAVGEYVIHVDPDDWVEPTMLAELYTKAKAEDADMVICDFFLHKQRKEPIYSTQRPDALDHRSVLYGLFNRLHGSCWNKLVRRACYEERNLRFPEHLTIWEDLFFNASLCMKPIKVAYLNKAFYHYDAYSNPNSLVRSASGKTIDSQRWLIDYFAQRLGDISQLDELKIATKERFFHTKHCGGDEVLNLYPEVNGICGDRIHAKSPFSRWLAHTIRRPSRCRLYRLLLSLELRLRSCAAKVRRFFIGI